ncbi:hypothetical protein HUU05_18315 [candidate division KSB1 bacterium]|nr:hypothetical protein [candidate division KSB1 bacterium]
MKFHTRIIALCFTAAIGLLTEIGNAQESLAPIAAHAKLQNARPAAFHLNDSTQTQSSRQKVSIGGAFLRSAFIPGWGQRATGAHTAARNFFVAEAGLWLGVISFNVRGNWLKDDYRLLASEHAQVEAHDKSDKYFVDVGNYTNIDEYNQTRLQRRDVASLYDPATHYWQWDSEANRNRFADLRLRSDRAFSRSELFVAAILANHIISGIHAAWLARRQNTNESPSPEGTASSPQFGVASFGNEIRFMAQVKF